MYGSCAEKDVSELIRVVVKAEEGDPDAILAEVEALEDQEEIGPEILPEEFLDQFESAGHEYLIERGLSVETQKAWGTRWDATQQRVVFPVRLHGGDLIGAVGRTVNNGIPKYWNYEKFAKAQVLFGEHLVRGRQIVVVEGPLDALAVWQALGDSVEEIGVVASMGSELSRVQIQHLVDLSEEVILFMDNDPAGLTASRKNGKQLQGRTQVRYVGYCREEYGDDPSSLISRGCSIIGRIQDAEILGWR